MARHAGRHQDDTKARAVASTVRRPGSAGTASPRKVRMLVYEGAHLLDIAGPISLFASASDFVGAPAYDVGLVAPSAGLFRSTGGIELRATGTIARPIPGLDTLLVAGGAGVDRALTDRRLLAWLQRQAGQTRRIASVCSGALLLAEAGLLDGRHAVTHWDRCTAMAARYPAVTVERDPIFLRDGKFYSSAGISAGMDLALALIEEDHGAAVAQALAREFVLYARRSGGQAQFSPALQAQETAPGKIKALQEWILAHLEEDLAVEVLAARSAMSPRHFARRFREETGMTPAAFVAAARLDAARQALAIGGESIDRIAHRFGFGTAERLRRTFQRHLAVTPTQFRAHFQVADAAQ
ncbi:MAG TPA: helix-turn-helix domain-containing protein [Dongiaceae bacterium]|nr:helix-turn-helix domain-containing protein [Dongiaceae bacterium]